MEYTPTKEDIAFAKDVYDKVIWTQTLNPIAVKEAFKKLYGYEAQNAQQAKLKVSMYFTYQYKPEMGSIGTVENLPLQSHEEDLTEVVQDDVQDDVQEYKPKARGRKKKQ